MITTLWLPSSVMALILGRSWQKDLSLRCIRQRWQAQEIHGGATCQWGIPSGFPGRSGCFSQMRGQPGRLRCETTLTGRSCEHGMARSAGTYWVCMIATICVLHFFFETKELNIFERGLPDTSTSQILPSWLKHATPSYICSALPCPNWTPPGYDGSGAGKGSLELNGESSEDLLYFKRCRSGVSYTAALSGHLHVSVANSQREDRHHYHAKYCWHLLPLLVVASVSAMSGSSHTVALIQR